VGIALSKSALFSGPVVAVLTVYKKIYFFEQGWESHFQKARFFQGERVH